MKSWKAVPLCTWILNFYILDITTNSHNFLIKTLSSVLYSGENMLIIFFIMSWIAKILFEDNDKFKLSFLKKKLTQINVDDRECEVLCDISPRLHLPIPSFLHRNESVWLNDILLFIPNDSEDFFNIRLSFYKSLRPLVEKIKRG